MNKIPAFLILALTPAMAATPAFAQVQPVRRVLEAASYFPLHEGYRWVYTKTGPTGTTTWQASVVEADGSLPRGGFHLLTGYFFGPPRTVHSDARGRVTETDFNREKTFLWYQLGASVGTTWELEWAPSPLMTPIAGCIAGSKLRIVSRDETVTVPAGEFHGVVHIEFRAPCVDAGITGEWFAPGVGLVRRIETTIAGPVTSELTQADLGTLVLPLAPYATTLSLTSSRYVNDLMPPVDLGALPVVGGLFTVRNWTDAPLDLTFSGCTSATITVQNGAGETVLNSHTDDGGCCTCKDLRRVTLGRSALVLPFSFRLVSDKGMPLPDGRYGVTVTLETLDAPSLRPSARALIEIASTY
jgi:hypothetical protein